VGAQLGRVDGAAQDGGILQGAGTDHEYAGAGRQLGWVCAPEAHKKLLAAAAARRGHSVNRAIERSVVGYDWQFDR